MLFALIFLSLFLLGWLFCAFLPWLAVSVATRGNAGLGMLPLCLFAGVVGGLAVPLLVNDGWVGVWMSFGAALVAPAALMAVRRMTLVTPERQQVASPSTARGGEPPSPPAPLPEGDGGPAPRGSARAPR